jgi:hypothetical protein
MGVISSKLFDSVLLATLNPEQNQVIEYLKKEVKLREVATERVYLQSDVVVL